MSARRGRSPSTGATALAAWIAGWIAAALVAGLAPVADATVVYAARAGRTCDNCHLQPDRWENPPRAERKCTLSCQGCHVDPAGGGLRNAVGRFYGRATLPMIATSPRPTADWDRDFLHLLGRRDRATTYTDSLPQGPASARERDERRFVPRDRWARGRPFGGASTYAPLQGREGALRSDPALRLGWDARLATLFSGGAWAYPMQLDLGVALHPVEHLTVLLNTGARGRTAGPRRTFDDPRTPYLREGFLMLHELPHQAYIRAGRFVPAFGLRLEDHTTQTRRAFELDGSTPEARVAGIEVGANPSYPHASLAWFRSTARGRPPDPFDPFDVDRGHGASLNVGWRDEGWSMGTSLLARRRPVEEGGDATSVSLHGSFNPWFYRRQLPVVLQVELDVGTLHRASGRRTRQVTAYAEADWLAGNGVHFLLAQDWSDPDTEVQDDEAWRWIAGVQVAPFPGLTFDVRGRALVPAGELAGADMLFQIHLWN